MKKVRVYLEKKTNGWFFYHKFYYGVDSAGKRQLVKIALSIGAETKEKAEAKRELALDKANGYEATLRRLESKAGASDKARIGADRKALFAYLESGGMFEEQTQLVRMSVEELYAIYEAKFGAGETAKLREVFPSYKRLNSTYFEKKRLRVESIKESDLLDYINWCRDERKNRAKTIKLKVEHFRMVWRAVHGLGLAPPPPPFKFTKKHYRLTDGKSSRQFRYMDEIEEDVRNGADESAWNALILRTSEIFEMLDECEKHKRFTRNQFWMPLLYFYCLTGCRRSEPLVLEIPPNWDMSSVRITNAKNDGKPRDIPIVPELRDRLKKWLAVKPKNRLLFCDNFGKPLTYKRVETLFTWTFKGRRSRAKVKEGKPFEWKYKRLTLHALRHSYISNLLSEGVAPAIVSEWSGHTNFKTLALYTRIDPNKRKLADGVFSRKKGMSFS